MNTSTVALPAGGAPLPAPGRRVLLSALDVYWVALPPVRCVFLFQSPPSVQFTDVVSALRSSLERVLPAFHPFAGVLTYSPDSHALSIVLPEACGVAFVEAKTDLELDNLVDDDDVLRQLSPDIHRDELPAPVMAVQVTEIVGGVAVGMAVHHCAADGRGQLRFLEMWTATARGQVCPGPEPLHDRRLVRFHGDDDLARLYLQQLAPDLPRVAPKEDIAREQGHALSRRTFTFSASAVRRLKQRLAATANTRTYPSTFAAMASLGWVSMARARGFTDDTRVFVVFLADCRAHMSPPVPGEYVGNSVALCTASLSGLELTRPEGPSMALLAIQEAVAEVKRDPLVDRAQWCAKFAAIPPGRGVVLAGSPWFHAYEMDFGFGRPARFLTSMNHDGEIMLIAGREPGSVQLSVLIDAEKMPALHATFQLERHGDANA
ncbi:BAHD acyltransferase DCR-like [Lolium rigidum]|uniref:BAHD acyltransferase DCR-like n=1 Tax=Lolium rigidum TaxID=89674 RepID=UPI001F5E092E|nr:BAHD acyltransferase DCR-like [Lolium rigidum]